VKLYNKFAHLNICCATMRDTFAVIY